MSAAQRSPYDSYGDGPQYRFAVPALTPMVKRLLVITSLAFALQYLVSFGEAGELWVNAYLGLAPLSWAQLFPIVPFWQLLTYGFLHDTHSLGHIAYNLLILYFFGTMLEGIVGSRRFLVVYLSAMLSGAVLHMLFGLFFGETKPAIGASGAVLGVMIATAVLQPNAQVILLFVPVKLKWLAIGLVTLDVYGLVEGWRTGESPYVAHFVHIGGAAYGFLAARRGWIWRDPIRALQTKRAVAQEQRRSQDEGRMDDLLARIHKEGLNTLSRREKDFLKRMSRRH